MPNLPVFGPNLAVFGPKILICTGVRKSFGTHMMEKIQAKILHPLFHRISTVLVIKTQNEWKWILFTPLTKILRCRRQWRQWQISPLNIEYSYGALTTWQHKNSSHISFVSSMPATSLPRQLVAEIIGVTSTFYVKETSPFYQAQYIEASFLCTCTLLLVIS